MPGQLTSTGNKISQANNIVDWPTLSKQAESGVRTSQRSLLQERLQSIQRVSRVQIIRDLQPLLYLVIDLGQARDGEPVRDPVFLGETAGVNQPGRQFASVLGESQAKVEASACGRL